MTLHHLILFVYLAVGGIIVRITWGRPDPGNRRRSLLTWFIMLLLVSGWGSEVRCVSQIDGRMREQLLRRASEIAHTIPPEHIRLLSFSPADRENPVYQRLCRQMRGAATFMDARSIYTVVQRHGDVPMLLT